MNRIISFIPIVALATQCMYSSAVSAEGDACSLVSLSAAAAAMGAPVTRTTPEQIVTPHGSILGCSYFSAGDTSLSVSVHRRDSPSEAKKLMYGMISASGMPADALPEGGLGDEAFSVYRTLFVRKADTVYTFSVLGHRSRADVESREVGVAKASLQ